MHTPLSLRVALALMASAGASVGFAQTSSAAAQTIDQALAGAIERKEVPGVVAIAADRNGVFYQGAFGTAEAAAGRGMTNDAIFRTASMTKAVTSVALMQYVEAGKVSLDDPASKYFPEFKDLKVFAAFDPATKAYTLRPAKSEVTVRQLLTHTSGLGYGFTSATLRDFRPREGEAYPVGPLLFDPGTDWVYGTGVDWAGKLVESLSGQTLEAYFQEKIFGPLKMVDTSYNVPAEKHARVVNNFRRTGDTYAEQTRQAPRAATRFNGGGGLYSTSGDYIRFLRMLLHGGELDGARILKADTVARMAQNHIGAVGVRALKSAQPDLSADFTFVADGRDKWGLGFQITTDAVPGKRAPGSLSWGGINNTFFWLDPKTGVAGVILMQYLPFADAKALGVYDAFERAVYQAVKR
jgi:methyl acetate hydrolase